jgi:acetyl esterase/lipase
MRKILVFLSIFTSIFSVDAQNDYKDEYQILYKNLYEGAIPNAKVADNKQKTEVNKNNHVFTTEISVPTIARFDPPENLKNGTTVIICPGGGYWGTADKHEGTDVAKVFNSWGVTAFVLRYRMPDERTSRYPSLSPLQDAQQAIRWVRKNAKTWGLKENQIGIMGYSAGGHLAATATTLFKGNADPSVSDSISVRPDFSMLIYAVISLKPELAHAGSRDKLLGKFLGETPAQGIRAFSNEDNVTSETPPTFLVHAADDEAVPVGNSIEFYQKCIKNKVPAEMHLYPKGGHGFGMDNKTTNDKWMERLQNWLDSLGLLKK